MEIFFLFLNDTDVKFDTREISWRRSTIAETISIVKRVESIYIFGFVKVDLEKEVKTYVVYLVTQKTIGVYPLRAILLVVLEQEQV